MNLIELREKRLEVWNKAKAFLDSHRKDGVLSAEDDAAYSRMEKELDDLGKEIIRQEKLDAYEKEMAKNLAEPLIGKPGGTPSEKTGRASDAYKNAMLDAMRCNFKRVRHGSGEKWRGLVAGNLWKSRIWKGIVFLQNPSRDDRRIYRWTRDW